MIIRKAIDNQQKYFPLPNCIFNLGLSAGEIAVYSYLMCYENRKNYRCHPSYSTIGNTIGLSKNTVKKKLLCTESTTVKLKTGVIHNGNLQEFELKEQLSNTIKSTEKMRFKRISMKNLNFENQAGENHMGLPDTDQPSLA